VSAAIAQDSRSQSDAVDSGVTYLWKASSFFVIAEFVGVPGWMLMKVVSSPIIQPDDVRFVRWGKIGLIGFVAIFLIRGIYDTAGFFGVNPVIDWLSDLMNDRSWRNPATAVRVFQIAFDFVFCIATSYLSLIGVVALQQHELKFADDDIYRDDERIAEKLREDIPGRRVSIGGPRSDLSRPTDGLHSSFSYTSR
jgi:hypothetical protein